MPANVGGGSRPRMGRPPLSERRRQDTRLEIAEAALVVFEEKGLATSSWEDIARAAGTSSRTLTRHFPRKEECIRPLLELATMRVVQALRGWPADRPLHDLVGTDWPQPDDAPGATHVRRLYTLTRSEPVLRMVWLDLFYENEAVIAEILGDRLGVTPGDVTARALAIRLNGALRLAVELWSERAATVSTSYADLVHQCLRTMLDGAP